MSRPWVGGEERGPIVKAWRSFLVAVRVPQRTTREVWVGRRRASRWGSAAAGGGLGRACPAMVPGDAPPPPALVSS